jgi:hypothetical protein
LQFLAPNNQIDFVRKMNPHVTLYLTDFQDAATPVIQQAYVLTRSTLRNLSMFSLHRLVKPGRAPLTYLVPRTSPPAATTAPPKRCVRCCKYKAETDLR